MHSNTFDVDVLGETEALLNNRLDGLYGCCALNRITLIRVGKRDSNYAVGSYPFLPTFPQGWAFFWRMYLSHLISGFFIAYLLPPCRVRPLIAISQILKPMLSNRQQATLKSQHFTYMRLQR